jgi:hypothetical protein
LEVHDLQFQTLVLILHTSEDGLELHDLDHAQDFLIATLLY